MFCFFDGEASDGVDGRETLQPLFYVFSFFPSRTLKKSGVGVEQAQSPSAYSTKKTLVPPVRVAVFRGEMV